MADTADVTIVGAGPYGLSVAAHLRKHRLNFRIIGIPMHCWLTKMPKGMLLKSAGFSSNISDPDRNFTLQEFCKNQGIPYRDIDHPIALETFSSYGISFQKRLVPELENEHLVTLKNGADAFELQMASGRLLKSRKVVIAVGMDYFRHIPEQLARFPKDLVSHSADHQDLQRFRGSEIAVLGSGSSAIDSAVLLHEAEAKVHLIARDSQIHIGGVWGGPARPLIHRMRAPISGIGPGWRSLIYTDAPWLYRYFPDSFRLRTAGFIGPSGGWFMKERVTSVPKILGHRIEEAKAVGSRVQLRLAGANGDKRMLSVDHVIAATGYKPDVHRLPFLGSDIVDRLDLIGTTPRLSASFESSMPGLYFVGPITTTSFGPVMRFVAGTGFTAIKLSRSLAQSLERLATL